MHREAALVAVLQLPANDPLKRQVFASWATSFCQHHKTQAAACYLAAGMPSAALHSLGLLQNDRLPSLEGVMSALLEIKKNE